MDNFFQTLRDIQKKERATGTLSEIDESFYDDASKYLQELLEIVNNNPLSLEAYQLRDAQRITIEICERREVKIINSAITNVQKSHNLFKGHNENSLLYEEIPYNTTPEEEALYKDMINTFVSHRENLMKEISPKKQTTNKIGFKPVKNNQVTIDANSNDRIESHTEDNTGSQVTGISSSSDKLDMSSNLDISDDFQDSSDSPTLDNSNDRSPSRLDASQVAMMFGKAPDDVLVDENNNPVKQKSTATGDMMAPFKPPTIPQDDTVSLQNNKKNITGNEDLTIENSFKESDENKSNNEILNQTETINETNQIEDDIQVVSEDLLDSEEIVEFLEELSTDILDENEKTYGPFFVNDVALLPKSIVKILKNNNVINIIK